MTTTRKFRLGAFIQATGHHVSAWRHPDIGHWDVPDITQPLAENWELVEVEVRSNF